MIMNVNTNSNDMAENKEFTKEEISTIALCSINGCSQAPVQTQEEIFIGFYH